MLRDSLRSSFSCSTFVPVNRPLTALTVKTIMETKILKVVKSGEVFSVKSEKSETGVLNKRNLVLKELGGKFENEYAVSVLGTAASLVFYEGDLVAVTLRFQTREFNGQTFQDIVATDVVKLKN